MIGWNIGVLSATDDGHSPATEATACGTRLAVWQTGQDGLHWLDKLAEAGNAINLGGNGYPNLYTAPAEYLLPRILVKPPCAYDVWLLDGMSVVDLPITHSSVSPDYQSSLQGKHDGGYSVFSRNSFADAAGRLHLCWGEFQYRLRTIAKGDGQQITLQAAALQQVLAVIPEFPPTAIQSLHPIS